jgi:hypothetical protein
MTRNGSKTVFGENEKNVAGRKGGKPFEGGTGTKNRWKKWEIALNTYKFLIATRLLHIGRGKRHRSACGLQNNMDGWIGKNAEFMAILLSKLKIFFMMIGILGGNN